MKKILSLALVALVAISAQSATISWSTAAMAFGGTTLKSNTSVSAYLIALEGTDFADSYQLTKDFSISSIGDIVSSCEGSKKSGKLGATADITDYSNGDAFAVLVTYKVDDLTYFNLSSSLQTLSGLDPSDPTAAPTEWIDYAFNNATSSEKGTLKAGGGWATAVPEPASAMLALAGVAMLIRRRK